MNNDFTWPQGHTAAAAFTFDVDAESCVLAHDPTSADCMSLMSHQSYGPRVGVPRILRILERQDVRATCRDSPPSAIPTRSAPSSTAVTRWGTTGVYTNR